MENLFKTLSAINVNERSEKKQNLTYLSWAWAWSEFKKVCPDATYDVWRDPATHEPFTFNKTLGYMCYVSVTANNETHEMWLPVMDGANKAMRDTEYTYSTRSGEKTVNSATMFDVNKTIMRCLVKCLAMFGLGIYIYAGEDLPEKTDAEIDNEKASKFYKSCGEIEEKHEGIIGVVLADFGLEKIKDVPAKERKTFFLQAKGLAKEAENNAI